MRTDLNKLLCEHERRGSRYTFKSKRRDKKHAPDIHPEDGGRKREGMKIRYGYEQKEFSENLNPLRGQIRKAVGRKWDAFYSDLCQVFDKRSVINQHILQHLFDFIEKDLIIKNGKYYVRRIYGEDIPIEQSYSEWYVDPRTGIIRVNKHRDTYRQLQRKRQAEREAEEAKVTRQIDDDTVLRKVDDTWFIFDLKPIPKDMKTDKGIIHGRAFDAFTRDWAVNESHRRDNRYHTNRRTASRKFLKAHNL